MSCVVVTAFAPCSRRTRSVSPKRIGTEMTPTFSESVRRMVMSDVSQIGDVPTVSSQPVVFDPVVNVPALSSFLVIAAIFSLLQVRVNAIGRAAIRRKKALEELRRVKSMELSKDGEERPSSNVVSSAMHEYEAALREEEDLRTVVPGVRLVAPNSSGNSQEDVEAAKRFLGLDLQPGEERKEPTLESAGVGLSTTAKVILAVVALSQLALLYILSYDPMTISNTFTSVGGGTSPLDTISFLEMSLE